MKKNIAFITVCCLLLTTLSATAQFLSFDKVDYNYNIIPIGVTNSQAVFSCWNRGTEPIIITKIVPSTDDISIELTRDTLLTDNRASINVTFTPKTQRLLFTEYIDVYTTDKMLSKITLTLKGTVKNISEDIEKQYPTVMDVARFTKLNVNFDKIYYPNTVVDTIGIYNPQDTAITLVFPSIPNYLTVQMFPEKIQPNSSALMVISFNSEERKKWGAIYDKLYFDYQGRKVSYKKRISISGIITEDFSKMTPKEMKKAPKIVMQTETFSFDTVRKGDPVECKFHFKNEGKSTLIIRDIKTTCGCTAGSMEKMVYLKGEEGDVNVSLDTRRKNGHVRQTITIISNDPVNTQAKVFIDGVVIE